MSGPIFTVANQLTILRMALVPLVVVLVLREDFVWAFWVFAVAALTDLLDGLIARLGNQQTKLGAMLDPVADKLLIGGAFLVLTWGSGLHVSIPVWLTVTAICRDGMLVVAVVIINLLFGPRVFYPTFLGKLSSAMQLLTAGFVLLLNALQRDIAGLRYLFVVTLVLTVSSAFQYVFRSSNPELEEA